MPSIPQRLYNQVMMLDDFTCVYCGERTPDVGIDHIIPRNYNGPDTLHNLAAACPSCNARKRDHQLHEVGMRLMFGRFTRPTRQASKRFIAASPPEYDLKRKPLDRPMLSRDEWTCQILQLAAEQGDDGVYRFSANKIRAIVGGNEAAVKKLVAGVRNP